MKENLFKDFYNRGFLEDKKNNVSVNGLKMLFDFLEELIEGKIKLDDELNEFEVMAKAVKEDELILKIKNYYENRGNDYNILKQESLKIIQSNDEITAKKIAEFYERVKENKLLDIIGLRFKIDNENNDLNELLFKISNKSSSSLSVKLYSFLTSLIKLPIVFFELFNISLSISSSKLRDLLQIRWSNNIFEKVSSKHWLLYTESPKYA
mgnify:CR=1 FL=1